MGKRIQGITIQIDGETVKLNDALKKVDTQLNATQRSLKDVNKLLKMDPKSTELLRQKQQYLGDAIKQTEQKLKAEEEALKQLKEDPTPENAEQQRALARDIEETKQKLSGLKKEYKEFGSVGSEQIKQVGADVKAMGQKVTDVGAGLTKNVTTPILAAGAASAAAWKEIDDGMDAVTKRTGATGDALREMQDVAKEIPQTINVSFADAGAAVGEVNTRFKVTGKELEDLSKKFLEFAAVNGEDVASSVDQAQKAMAAWNIPTKDAGIFLDTLNKVGQDTGVSMGTLMASLAANKTELSEMGFSAADAANFLGQCEVSGTDVSTVMAGMKKAMQNATKEGKTLSGSLQEFDGVMDSNATDAEKLQAAYDLFGKKAGAAIYEAASKGSLSFDELGQSLENNLGSVSSTFEEAQDPVDKMATTLNTLKVVGADLIDVAGTVGLPIIMQIGQKAKELKSAWDGLSPSQQQMIIKIAGIAAVAGPLISIIGGLITGVGGLITSVGTISAFVSGTFIPAFAAAGPAVAAFAAPILPAIAIVGGLVGAGVLLYKNWDKVSKTGKELGKNLKKIGGDIKTGVTKAWTDVKSATSEKWDSIKKSVKDSMEGAKKDTQSGIEKIKGFFKFDIKLPDVKAPKWPDINEKLTNIKAKLKFDWKLPTIGHPSWPDLNDKLSKIKAKLKFDWKLPTIGHPSWPDISDKLSKIKNKLSFSWKLPKIGAPSWPDISDKLSKIKDKLKFNWKLPEIGLPSMPHISLDWASKTFFGREIRYPTGFSVDWNAKAMNSGLIMKKPTIFGVDTYGRLMGGGEVGSETVVGTNSLMNMVKSAASSGMRGQSAEMIAVCNYWGQRFMQIMAEYFPQFAEGNITYLDGDQIAGKLTARVDRQIGRQIMHKERGI